jgi:ABC-type transporter Mla maintaining outer membrane lipid asymmetry ATPase subunit MlaF
MDSDPKLDAAVLEMVDASIASALRAEVAGVESINWCVMPGEFWVVGGLHSSGKTALVTTAAGLQRPLNGSVRLFGQDFFSLDESQLLRERKRIGVVFENGGRMFRDMTVRENIALPLFYHHANDQEGMERRTTELLEHTGLSNVAGQPVQILPTIIQQRAALARALALEPELIIVDKPLTGSRDPRWWPDILRRISDGTLMKQDRPITVIVTTEDLQPWTGSATNFAMLKTRRWHLLGTAAEVQHNKQPMHKVLLADENEE